MAQEFYFWQSKLIVDIRGFCLDKCRQIGRALLKSTNLQFSRSYNYLP